jgi:hypothetical protein
MKTLPWVAVGLVLLLGPLPLEAAFEVRPPPEAIPQKLEVRETPTELRIELPGDVLFDFDKGDIRPELRAANEEVRHEDCGYWRQRAHWNKTREQAA